MSSIINSAMSGLSAAQAALSTTSNNISNYTVAGYSRQTILLSQANSTLQGAGGGLRYRSEICAKTGGNDSAIQKHGRKSRKSLRPGYHRSVLTS
ncbi:hypothetical protein CRX72_14670 [Pantoea sp. BRM17]|nr:hypothetical protein CRX72_14670 [Pantoea sp. BRM17]